MPGIMPEKDIMGNQVDILSTEGQPTGALELPDELFSSRVSEYALYRAVVTYEANQRQGTASSKGRSEIRRTGKKHHRQKGTGWARRGSLRSPLVRGGGVAFGPHPRSYRQRMPKSLKRLAFTSALTLKGQNGAIKVVDDFEMPTPSTQSFARIIKACGLDADKILVVTGSHEPVLHKSCRNIPSVKMTPIGSLGTYDLLAADIVVFTRSAFELLGNRAGHHAHDGQSRSLES